jgi:hypothetical protein
MPSATMPTVTVAGFSGPLGMRSTSWYMLADSVAGSMPSKYTVGCTVNTLLFSREVPASRVNVTEERVGWVQRVAQQELMQSRYLCRSQPYT